MTAFEPAVLSELGGTTGHIVPHPPLDTFLARVLKARAAKAGNLLLHIGIDARLARRANQLTTHQIIAGIAIHHTHTCDPRSLCDCGADTSQTTRSATCRAEARVI